MVDITAMADAVLLQLNRVDAQALAAGVGIVLPQYLDASEIRHLEQALSVGVHTRDKVTHQLGECRIWVREQRSYRHR